MRWPITVLHADLEEKSFPLRRQVLEDVDKLPNAALYVWYENGAESDLPVAGTFAGLMDVSQVTLPEDAVYYLCRPVPFMQSVRSALVERGVAAKDIQYEVFGPDLWQADTD